MKSICLSILLLFLGGCLWYKAMHSHAVKVYNMGSAPVTIVKTTELNEEGVRLRGVFPPGQLAGVSVLHTLPFRAMRIVWERGGEQYEQIVTFRLPKGFTPYDGASIILLFDDSERIRLAYECYYGDPPEEAEEFFDKRTGRKTRCVLEDGTPFDPVKASTESAVPGAVLQK